LEFDTDTELFEKVHRVRYEQGLPSISLVDALEDPDSTFWMAGVLTKAKRWSYEREWRAEWPIPLRTRSLSPNLDG